MDNPKTKYVRFTKLQRLEFIRLYPNHSNDWLAARYKTTVESILHRAQWLGLNKTKEYIKAAYSLGQKKRIDPKRDYERMLELGKTMSNRAIAEVFGVSKGAINKHMKRAKGIAEAIPKLGTITMNGKKVIAPYAVLISRSTIPPVTTDYRKNVVPQKEIKRPKAVYNNQ